MRRRGFSLIELLVVIAIIAILAAIIFPVYAQAKKGAYKASDLSNMNALRTALQLYKTDNGAFPPALLGYVGPYSNLKDGGANVVPPNAVRDALYSKRVESLTVFRPALDRIAESPAGTTTYAPGSFPYTTGTSVVTGAYWPGTGAHAAGSRSQRFGSGDKVMRAVYDSTNTCNEVPAFYYRVSGYDVAPADNRAAANMESHYQLFWSGWAVPGTPCGTDAGGSANDDPRQLGYAEPPETTVVTWNPFFRDYQGNLPLHQKQDLVLFLGGNARPMDSRNVYDQAWGILP